MRKKDKKALFSLLSDLSTEFAAAWSLAAMGLAFLGRWGDLLKVLLVAILAAVASYVLRRKL